MVQWGSRWRIIRGVCGPGEGVNVIPWNLNIIHQVQIKDFDRE